MSTTAFTICSINYLAQAITLGNSLKASNPDVGFTIYLVDKFAGREELKDAVPFPVIEIENVPVTDFEGMCSRYRITELNTAVKPFIFDHIYKSEREIDNIIYFDPDIMVFESLSGLYENLTKSSIIITPHILTPSDEHPYGQAERNYLLAGVFNLGFIALSRSSETFKFLDWWKLKLIDQGFADESMHLFYDQKWLIFAPVYFNNVHIEKSPGYNMAGWNLHEREVTAKIGHSYIINKVYKLVFYHFSGVKVHATDISKYSKYAYTERPDLKELVDNYRSCLINNRNEIFSSTKCYYSQFYKGRTIYYPKYHWITLYRRTRFYLGKYKRLLTKELK